MDLLRQEDRPPTRSAGPPSIPREAVGVELEDAGVLGDGALHVFWDSFGELGFYLDRDLEPCVGEGGEVR